MVSGSSVTPVLEYMLISKGESPFTVKLMYGSISSILYIRKLLGEIGEWYLRNLLSLLFIILAAQQTASTLVEGEQDVSTLIRGCGLAFLAPSIEEHHANKSKRFNKLPTRLIGEQAIALAQFGYRLVDCLEFTEESPVQRVLRLALAEIVLHLRNACVVFNKISTTEAEMAEIDENCRLILPPALFVFSKSC
jgi:hypothetical protein